MRAITGKYKGRHFDVPSNFKARPTTDFAKENIFNVLRGRVDFEGLQVLDLFAGTGSISLEFLSRGAARVVSVEKDPRHFAFIRSVMARLGDAAACPLRADALRELGELPERVMGSHLLRPGGLFVLEHGRDHDFSALPGFLEHRAYGSVNFSLFAVPEI